VHHLSDQPAPDHPNPQPQLAQSLPRPSGGGTFHAVARLYSRASPGVNPSRVI
jgi:hypothetical protein